MMREKKRHGIRKALTVMLILAAAMSISCGAVFAEEPVLISSAGAEVASVDFTGASITVSPQNTLYTGYAIVPKVTVVLNGKTLVEGTDYVLAMPEVKDAGRHIIGIAAMGNYTGTAIAECNVIPVNLTGASISVTRDITTADLTADHKAVEPAVLKSIVRVTQSGTDVSSWCSLTSSVNGNTVTVTAAITNGDGTNVINSSTGRTCSMKTDMSDCVIEILDSGLVYNGEAQKPSVKVYNLLTSGVLKESSDYILQYQDNVNAGYAIVTAKGVGSYTGTTKMYFAIAAKDLYNCTTFFTNGRSSSMFTGKEIQPLVTIRDGSKRVLVQGKDYDLTYTDAKNQKLAALKESGIYRVTVTGMNNYTGKVELEYEVGGTDISDYTVNLRYDRVKADGTAKVPEVVSVVLDDVSSLTTAEYDVSWLDADGNVVTELIKPGKYTVVVTGKNGFHGTASAVFEILGQDQNLALAKTSYKVYKKSKDFKLTPESDNPDVVYTFVSSNPEVASVSADGVVNVHKLGRAKITVTASGSDIYNAASKDVIVKVYPYKAVLTRKPWTDGEKKSFRVRWETQADVTYYQVRYSTSKTFKSGTYKTKKVNASTKNYATQSTKVTGLKSGKTYYVKVRAVKVAYNDAGSKLYYYGNWSGWKSVKTK